MSIVSSTDDAKAAVAHLLATANERLSLADEHELEGVRLATAKDADSIARAAHHFVIAEALRGRARFAGLPRG